MIISDEMIEAERILSSLRYRILNLDLDILEIPQQAYYEEGHEYWKLLEKRNEYIEEAWLILKRVFRRDLPKVRIHQRADRAFVLAMEAVLKEYDASIAKKKESL